MEVVTSEKATAPAVQPAAAPASLRATLLRQATHYSLGTFLAMFAAIARAGVGAHYLPAAQVGTWLALQVLVGYATILHFGTVFGMFRSVPIKLALGDVSGARAYWKGLSARATRRHENVRSLLIGAYVIAADKAKKAAAPAAPR